MDNKYIISKNHQVSLGLCKDTEPINTPEGFYNFALNAIHDAVDGAQGSISNENANKICSLVEGDVVGIIPADGENAVVFTEGGNIYLFDSNTCTVSLEKSLSCLNFNKNYPITGQYIVRKGCERTVYFRDSLNPDRHFIFDRKDRFETCNDFNLNPDIEQPCISTMMLNGGGRLEYGAYSFIVEILDSNFNVVYKSVPSLPVYIYDDSAFESEDVDVNPIDVTTSEDFVTIGLNEGLPESGARPISNNSIKLNISNIDTNFSFIRIGVIRYITSDGITPSAHYVGEIIPITGVSQVYFYRGFNTANGDFREEVNKLLSQNAIYESSKSMEQVQGRLTRWNLTEKLIDYSTFQQAASKICTKYIVSDINPGEDRLTEQGDEIKANGIVYVFNNGQLSPVFHIPGREKLDSDAEIISTNVIGNITRDDRPQKEISIQYRLIYVRAAGDVIVSVRYEINVPVSSVKVIVDSQFEEFTSSSGTTEKRGILVSLNSVNVRFEIVDTEDYYYTVEDTVGNNVDFSYGVKDRQVTLKSKSTASNAQIEKWQLYNTAIKDDTPIDGYSSSGRFGYYECGQVYTNPANYCGDDYWGTDCNGNKLLGTPIRHNRVPCRTIEPLINDNGQLRYIGTYFTNVTYPHPDIVGHFFVTNYRDFSNSTVLASGISLPYNYEEDSTGDKAEGRYIHYLPNSNDNEAQTNTNVQNFISIPFLVDGTITQGSYIKTNGYFNSEHSQNRKKYEDFYDEALPYKNLQLYGKHHQATTFETAEEFIRLRNSYYLPKLSTTLEYPNKSISSDFNILDLYNQPETFSTSRANLNYSYIKQDIPVHCNLYSIRYRMMHNCIYVAGSLDDTYEVFGGDTFISPLQITNISDISFAGTDIRWGNLAVPIIGIGVFISSLFKDSQVNIEYELIQDLYVESPHNFRYRLTGTDLCNTYYVSNIDQFIISKTSEAFNPSSYKLRDSICSEWYGYNKDYSVITNTRTFLPLQITYDFCSDCYNRYPNRGIWSEVYSDEQIADAYRIYKPLNYIDIPANRGGITAVNYKNNKLYVRTQQSLFYLQPNAQKLQTGDLDIYLGTGDFLGIPPYEIQSTDIGYAGQNSILAQANCLYGLVWADEEQGKIFSLSDTLEEISKYKMYHWFEQNLPSNIKSFLRSKNINFAQDRFGSRITYDPKYERLIVHKIDYKPTQTFLDLYNSIYFQDNHFYHKGVKLDYNNEAYFENKSWTLSYSFRTKTWISWHSYQPDFMFYSKRTFYSIIGNELWSHDNYYEFNKFYDKSYPHIIEFADTSGITSNLHAIHYYAQAQEFIDGQWIDKDAISFDKGLVYTRHQSTGLFNLNYKQNAIDSLIWSNTTKPLIQTDKNYKIAQLRDIAINSPVNTTNWDIIRSEYENGQGYIDILPNLTNLNLNTPQHELNEFRDKWCLIRLYFNKSNYRIVTYIVNTQQMYSVR